MGTQEVLCGWRDDNGMVPLVPHQGKSHSILLFPGVEPGELQGKGTSKARGGMEAERVLQLLGGPAGTLGPLRR